MLRRLNLEQIEAIARRVEAGELIATRELGVMCEMAVDHLRSAPSLEMIRLAHLLVSSRGALPLDAAQAVALGSAILQAARPSLLAAARNTLQETHAALELGRNWTEGLARIPIGSTAGPRLPGLARSMAKTMQRHLLAAAETLNFGMPGQPEPLDVADRGYKEVPGFAQIVPRTCTDELERAHEALRLGRLGMLKIARFAHATGGIAETRTWDATLAQLAARSAQDAGAHVAALQQLLDAHE